MEDHCCFLAGSDERFERCSRLRPRIHGGGRRQRHGESVFPDCSVDSVKPTANEPDQNGSAVNPAACPTHSRSLVVRMSGCPHSFDLSLERQVCHRNFRWVILREAKGPVFACATAAETPALPRNARKANYEVEITD